MISEGCSEGRGAWECGGAGAGAGAGMDGRRMNKLAAECIGVSDMRWRADQMGSIAFDLSIEEKSESHDDNQPHIGLMDSWFRADFSGTFPSSINQSWLIRLACCQ